MRHAHEHRRHPGRAGRHPRPLDLERARASTSGSWTSSRPRRASRSTPRSRRSRRGSTRSTRTRACSSISSSARAASATSTSRPSGASGTAPSRALAVVVAQYRAISLRRRRRASSRSLAADPTETKETIDALAARRRCELAARRRRKTHAKALGAPARRGDRSFLLYGTPVRGGGAIVVASDAAIFLGAVAWTPLPVARLFVTDPAGVVWAGCETPRRVRRHALRRRADARCRARRRATATSARAARAP